ncbi:MAG TPA: DoxX family protein [Mucilaginibacter sp.]
MKAIKITYWVTTVIVALMMTYSAYVYLTQPMMAQAFSHLGFPPYFRVELAIAKVIGAILLIAPVASKIKEWTYAGFVVVFLSAFIAHTASGDPVSYRIMPVIFLALLIVSYYTRHRLNNVTQTPKAQAA